MRVLGPDGSVGLWCKVSSPSCEGWRVKPVSSGPCPSMPSGVAHSVLKMSLFFITLLKGVTGMDGLVPEEMW